MKITIEAYVDGEKKTIEYECNFCFLVNGKDTKTGLGINRYIHFDKVDTKDFDKNQATYAEFFAIKSLLEHFEDSLKFSLGIITDDILEKFLKE